MEGGPEDENEGEGEQDEANSKEKGKGNDSKKGAEEKGCGEEKEYEFTRWEERVLEVIFILMTLVLCLSVPVSAGFSL